MAREAARRRWRGKPFSQRALQIGRTRWNMPRSHVQDVQRGEAADLAFIKCAVVLEDVGLAVHARAERPLDACGDGLFAGANSQPRTQLVGRYSIKISTKPQGPRSEFWRWRAGRQPCRSLRHGCS